MAEVDGRLLFWAVWAVGTVVVYGANFLRRLATRRRHRDPRSSREAVEAFGYLLVAVAAFFGITVAIYARGAGLAALLFAVAGGAFFVNGLYAVIERVPENGNRQARRQ